MIGALLFVVPLAGPVAADSPAAPLPEKEISMSLAREEEAVRRTLAAFTESVNRGDYEAVLDMVTEDAVFWTANYPSMTGKAALREAYAGLAPYRVHQEFEIEELRVCGEWAFAAGYENFTLDPKDGKGERLEIKKRRAISILRRQPDGSWKTARGMTNYDSPQPQSQRRE
jgi:uncharacterized protein (TIGR02246 family)